MTIEEEIDLQNKKAKALLYMNYIEYLSLKKEEVRRRNKERYGMEHPEFTADYEIDRMQGLTRHWE